jgi:hypothetical protein
VGIAAIDLLGGQQFIHVGFFTFAGAVHSVLKGLFRVE